MDKIFRHPIYKKKSQQNIRLYRWYTACFEALYYHKYQGSLENLISLFLALATALAANRGDSRIRRGEDYEEKMHRLAEHIRERTPPESRIISTHSLLVAHRVTWRCIDWTYGRSRVGKAATLSERITSKRWFSKRNPSQNCCRLIYRLWVFFLFAKVVLVWLKRCVLFLWTHDRTKALVFFQKTNGDEKGTQNQQVYFQTVWNRLRAKTWACKMRLKPMSWFHGILYRKKSDVVRTCLNHPLSPFLWKNTYYLLLQQTMPWWP